ncbi:hypothetical protein [Halobacillus sp. Nhm2S1]|uniref:hypothetical protein n=1 Tax=Halobacillus sp. Nhm2S1 TaxID=2866716 RepID=UPI001C72A94D|nr:hypothetical protein [Halobacillus sp. Nhm2S1]MBX0358458.1 hypothetical protein [Halobacillus sp. Nhm2S1]
MAYLVTSVNHDIDDNEKAVQEAITEKLEGMDDPEASGEIENVKITNIGESDLSITTFLLNGTMDYALLERAWTGNYSLETIDLGTSAISYRGVKTDNGSYGVVFGKKFGRNIESIDVKIQKIGHSFSLNVLDEETFVRYEKLPEAKSHRFYGHLTYKDENNERVELN